MAEKIYGACVRKQIEGSRVENFMAFLEAWEMAEKEKCGDDGAEHVALNDSQAFCMGRMSLSLVKTCKEDPTYWACKDLDEYLDTYKSMGLSPKNDQICCLFKIDTSKITCK